MKIISRVPALGALCLLACTFTGCEQTLKLQAQEKEIDAKITALRQEQAALDAQIAALKPALPFAGSNEEAARILYSKASGELTILESSLKTTAASLKETEASVAALKQEIAAQRPKAE
ncbi:MAG TPA: hypothetical protein VD994_18115 [Prosthecobacter sp.]|nr:hypothetical protein [Prosthecobacter sp.]